jgi:hypothetical protein
LIKKNSKGCIVFQGEVEQIALMKPKATNNSEVGMLEYLEDIIGSNKYVEKIEATAKEVEVLNEERTEKLNRVKLVEKERDGLEVTFPHITDTHTTFIFCFSFFFSFFFSLPLSQFKDINFINGEFSVLCEKHNIIFSLYRKPNKKLKNISEQKQLSLTNVPLFTKSSEVKSKQKSKEPENKKWNWKIN